MEASMMSVSKRSWKSISSAVFLCLVITALRSSFAQAPGVEIVRDKGEQFTMLVEKANKLLEEGALLPIDKVAEQIQRESCDIELPKPGTKPLTDREIWQRSKDAHLRVGWHYRCKKCDKWHQNLAGGYFINTDGAVATCYHVIDKTEDDYRDGYLVAANDKGDLFPVLEVLAADEVTDTAIIRIKAEGPVTALPLNANTYPGDEAWCYSDPLGRSGYFSKGMINRFYVYKKKGREEESARMEVSTDWAPGSSGAAVLDEFGNAIGHVSEISSAGTHGNRKVVLKPKDGSTNDVTKALSKETQEMLKGLSKPSNPVIVFHCASRAADVLALVKGKDEKEEAAE